ncbi:MULTISPECIES: TAT-variant-translocated molybdopterin oxidoreductase [Flavobacteriaceae]|uniref:4Fe-4S dicluster domain-containing protein n=2 Tax=Flavobacteriaceae TaxID=49546 RepID=A0A4Y8AQZ1_9FLAO|nr:MULTISPECIES: TAT-variant-translocated molybdopterin oxidoreductase [Flavobacteriaceae]TEW72453.1 4Fe-4S dicluster domain-containing protein [Gramella jeungdoensis]GGK55678.1 quinol:cytochrome C oxidoreductase [Lutibacter litoralis]
MASNKKYWKSVEELNTKSSIVDTLKQNEFVEEIPTDEFLGNKENLETSSTTRRDFLKYVGFTTAAASLAACEGPVVKSIPYVIKPDDIIPGVAEYYATTMADGFDFANILVKVREGRPIKIDPNKEANGSTNARVQASVLSLYDSHRLKKSRFNENGAAISWANADSQIISKLNEVKEAGLPIAVLTGTCASPSTKKLINNLGETFGNVNHVVYDAVSESTALDAFEAMYGTRALPDYNFEKAEVIVSIGADFLGDWQGGGFDAGYSKSRIPTNGKMSRHIQIESNMTLTGANADKRFMVKPSEQNLALIKLYQAVVKGIATREATPLNETIQKAAQQIKVAGTKAVVVTGIQDKNAQLLALAINQAINSEVIDVVATKNVRIGNDAAVAQLITDMNAGKIGAVIINNSNPVYTLPNSNEFVEGLKKVKLSVAFSMQDNETANAVQYALATPHYLESWGDAVIKKGQYSLMQPTIKPLFDTRQFQDALLVWTGSTTTYYDFLKETWNTEVLEGKSWNQALHDGVFTAELPTEEITLSEVDIDAAGSELAKITGSEFELSLYTKTGLGDGQMANNPWLQELPDPITRTSWDNYLTMSKADAEVIGAINHNVANGALNGSLVEVSVNGISEVLPVLIQPGQAKGSLGLALGYGRKQGLKAEMQTGKNAYQFYKGFNNYQSDVTLKLVAGEHEFACVQLHNTLMGRGDIIKETTIDDYNNVDSKEWNVVPVVSLDHNEVEANSVDLWEAFDRSVGHHFNLSIDLNACTGCGACVVACHAENNVPVVGKEEIRKSRDMHWLRIDRYYSHEEDFAGDNEKKEAGTGVLGYKDTMAELEDPSENPSVAFQPVMCQHCNHAPCETVCPVAATSHGRQGQNQMAYNRCVGTRYCANNCPYKVRRFNWFNYPNNSEFDYNMNDDLGKMVLNPDVTVRSRGVMEKCSMCIQMTQATILKAKKEGRPVNTNEFETACSNACTNGAMVFGDVNKHEDTVASLAKDKRAYHLLEHIGTKPNVVYHVKVRNTQEA